jgi:hypothetical protein
VTARSGVISSSGHLVISLCFLLFLVSPLHAQSIRGTLHDQTSHAVISDALVQVLADRERVVASGTSSGRGEYLLRAPVDGVYRIRVLRIGFRPWTSDTLTLRSQAIRLQDLEVDAGVVVLTELTVTARSGCKRSPADDARMEAVWQQARTMLGLIEAGAADLEFRVRTHDRTLDQWERLRQESSRVAWGRGSWPVISQSPDSLAMLGFIQTTDTLEGPVYYGPDVAVFFSDAFLGSHCFRLLPPPRGEADLIGLGFEPLPGRRVADIQGVLWVHRREGLSRLEYQYASMPSWIKQGKAGGMLRFDRLDGGRPIITDWSLQAPVPRIEQSRVILHGYRETAGEVEEVREGTQVRWRRTAS